ncbi:unnamed protein product, partial [Prorocentrum cordatum]
SRCASRRSRPQISCRADFCNSHADGRQLCVPRSGRCVRLERGPRLHARPTGAARLSWGAPPAVSQDDAGGAWYPRLRLRAAAGARGDPEYRAAEEGCDPLPGAGQRSRLQVPEGPARASPALVPVLGGLAVSRPAHGLPGAAAPQRDRR